MTDDYPYPDDEPTDADLANAPEDDTDESTEDTGRWQGGYRIYRDGSYREDFRSDC